MSLSQDEWGINLYVPINILQIHDFRENVIFGRGEKEELIYLPAGKSMVKAKIFKFYLCKDFVFILVVNEQLLLLYYSECFELTCPFSVYDIFSILSKF